MRQYLETVLILFVLVWILIPAPADTLQAAAANELDVQVRVSETAGDPPKDDAEEIIDLLWWLRRAGSGGPSFMESLGDLYDDLGTIGGYFHNGPSR